MSLDYQKIKRHLESKRCPVHAQKPVVNISGSKVSINSCCDSFNEKLSDELEKLIVKQTEEAIQKAFRF